QSVPTSNRAAIARCADLLQCRFTQREVGRKHDAPLDWEPQVEQQRMADESGYLQSYPAGKTCPGPEAAPGSPEPRGRYPLSFRNGAPFRLPERSPQGSSTWVAPGEGQSRGDLLLVREATRLAMGSGDRL